ncbi:MAG: outer membrane beta-barrel protein [Bacteroidales bacterium]|nr:outer membrane beta-barrel protein [Bacteroidales bacterium]
MARFIRAVCHSACLFLLCLIYFHSSGQSSIWKAYNPSNSGIPGASLKCLAADREGNIWAGTFMSGLALLKGDQWKIFNRSNSGLPHEVVNALAVDPSGRIWIGTDGGGLACYDGANWKVYTSRNSGLPSNVVMSIFCQENGTVWVGTYFGGIAAFDGENWQVYNPGNSGMLSEKIICITADTSGIIWAGTHGGGVASFNGTSWRTYNERNSDLPNDFIYSITVDSKNKKWIGTGGGGVAVFNDIFWDVYTSDESGLTDNNIRPIASGIQEISWIGTYMGGVCAVSEHQWFAYHPDNSPLPQDEVNAILYRSDSTVWIATERNGLFVMRDTLATYIRKQNELFVTNTHTILFDPKVVEHIETPVTVTENIVEAETLDPDAPLLLNNITVMFDAADIHNNPDLQRLYFRSFGLLLKNREQVDHTFAVKILVYSSKKGVDARKIALDKKQKEALFAREVIYMDGTNRFSNALTDAFEMVRTNFNPNGDNHVIAGTYRMMDDDEKTIRELLSYNLDQYSISFSLLAFGPVNWKEEHQLRDLIPRGGGQYYRIEPAGLLDNWSGTIQFGSSIFRGDMDVTQPVSFPGEFGFAINKKVVSNGLFNGGIKGQFNFGELSGKKGENHFENKYRESCLNFQVILNSWINRNFKFEKIRPYGFAGIGMITYRTLLRNGDGMIISGYGYDIRQDDPNKADKSVPMRELIFPLGAGVNYRLKDKITLEFEISTRYINSDKLDARVIKKDDKYIFFSLGCTYRFPEKEFLSNILNR